MSFCPRAVVSVIELLGKHDVWWLLNIPLWRLDMRVIYGRWKSSSESRLICIPAMSGVHLRVPHTYLATCWIPECCSAKDEVLEQEVLIHFPNYLTPEKFYIIFVQETNSFHDHHWLLLLCKYPHTILKYLKANIQILYQFPIAAWQLTTKTQWHTLMSVYLTHRSVGLLGVSRSRLGSTG